MLTQLINDGGVCRTAPATPGLLIIETEEEEKNVRWPAKISDTLFDQRSPVNQEGLIQ